MRISGKRLTGVWVLAALAGGAGSVAQKRYVAPGAAGEITQPVLTELWRAAERHSIGKPLLWPGRQGARTHGPSPL